MLSIEERLNTYSHAFGIVLTFLGGFLLFEHVQETTRLDLIVYSISLILLFTASTLYHAVRNRRIKSKLRIVDHISIYYLIAGTYTPVCVAILKDSKGMLLLVLVWGIALFGTILKLFFTGKFEVFSLILYGIMGWLVLIDLPYLIEHTTGKQLYLIGLGGILYTVGILFYTVKRIPFNHFIWHLFVLAGAISHWFLIYSIVK